MPIDVEKAVAADPDPVSFSWTDDRVLLYHLALGAGADPTDPAELALAYEKDLTVLPTFAVVAGMGNGGGSLNDRPGIDIDLHALLHGEQVVEVHGGLPAAGEGLLSTRVTDVWDKGKAAVIRLASTAATTDGDPLWTTRMSLFVRGEGGFGGDPGPRSRATVPDRAPDHVLRSPTRPDQALLYRLTGDRNPLHADPAFAALAGFDRPILHGLCTYGIACKAVVQQLLGGDTARVRTYGARFAGVVFPGETLLTSVWEEGQRLLLSTTTEERGEPVLTHAAIDLT